MPKLPNSSVRLVPPIFVLLFACCFRTVNGASLSAGRGRTGLVSPESISADFGKSAQDPIITQLLTQPRSLGRVFGIPIIFIGWRRYMYACENLRERDVRFLRGWGGLAKSDVTKMSGKWRRRRIFL